MTDHPITPPPELVQQWIQEADGGHDPRWQEYEEDIAARAAQWGADQELEACCELLKQKGVPAWSLLRSHRRPKTPSLAKTAMYELDEAVMRGDCITTTDAMPHLRAALKRLAELEESSHD